MANLVKDLYKSSDAEPSQTSHTVVASFFCQHQTKKTLVAEGIMGSLVHQIVRSLGPDDIDRLPLSNISTASDEMPIDFHAILSRIRQSRRQKDRRYFVAIDALDECPAEESSMVIRELVRMAKHLPLLIVLSARSGSVLLDRLSRLPPVSRLSMANSTKDFEIAQNIDREMAVRLGDGRLNAEIVDKIKFVLTAAAQGMYLWVALQLETIMPQHGGLVSQDNILSMLENLPRNLHEAYARGLARINDKRYGSRIFMLVAGAARPLKIKELRVALNITPCETFWSPSSMVLDPSSLVWSCGSGLLEIDESDGAVYWIHHSAMRCLLHQDLGNDPSEIPKILGGFRFQLSDAERELGRICVTFLSFDVHDRRVQVRKPMFRSDLAVKVINDSIPTDSWIAKLRRPQASKQGECVAIAIDISRVAETLGGIQVQDQESFNDFLEYSQEHWIQHSRDFWTYPPQSNIDRICEGLFRRLFNPEMTVAMKPWALNDVDADSAILWASRNDNPSVFFHFTSGPGKMLTETPTESVVDWLSKLVTDHPSTFKLHGKMMTIILQWKLIYCVHQKDLEYLTGFMDVLVRLSQFSLDGLSAFHFAVQPPPKLDPTLSDIVDWVRVQLFWKLLDHGVEPTQRLTDSSHNLLYSVIDNGWTGCARVLITAFKSQIQSPAMRQFNHEGTTLLGLVIEKFRYNRRSGLALIDFLLSSLGQDPSGSYYNPRHENWKSEFGGVPWPHDFRAIAKPPLIVAISYRWWELARLLVSHSADVKRMFRNCSNWSDTPWTSS